MQESNVIKVKSEVAIEVMRLLAEVRHRDSLPATRTLWAENKLLATRAPFFDYPLRVLLLPLSLLPI
jgi:hypothetical protein